MEQPSAQRQACAGMTAAYDLCLTVMPCCGLVQAGTPETGGGCIEGFSSWQAEPMQDAREASMLKPQASAISAFGY